ncbi:MAG: pimeloyl-ACP methyl ester carboxylesterase [Gammaproteobacteria bacterium]|jgi:pimeloyl-ACP methyl ester carboxylesterase
MDAELIKRAVPTDLPPALLPTPLRVIPVVLRDKSLLFARQHGNPDGPRLVISHGNGMAADLYYPYWKHFLADFEVIVFDVRNHGWNPTSDVRRHHFPAFVFDNESLLDALDVHLGIKPALGAFHSMSALTALYQAARMGPRWAGLVLFDPPLSPTLGHPLEDLFLTGQVAISDRAARRQSHYDNYGEFEKVVRKAAFFKDFEASAYPLYAPATFRPRGDGGVELRCPREYEAHIYLSNLDSTIALSMGSFPCPLKVIGADPTRESAGPPSRVCEALFPSWGVDYHGVPGTSHFLQLEAPEVCAALTREFFERSGLA